jgi:hypothetical protein
LSYIAWLDASTTEQSRMREFVRLNSEHESRDELGIGAVRDTLSDGLFPGSSTLHTRARYLLLIPWAFQAGAGRATGVTQALPRAETLERRLINAFKNAGETAGLIGADVGAKVKNLPSRLYWAALSRYGMLLDSRISRAYAAELTFAHRHGLSVPGVSSPWLPTLPPVPADFPLGQAFALDHAEAQLLQEQMIRATQGSLLAHLLLPGNRPQQSFAPWAEPALDHASQTVRELVRNARLFSLAINGAALLYGLLLAEEYERLGYSGLDDPADLKRNAVAAWEDERAKSRASCGSGI